MAADDHSRISRTGRSGLLLACGVLAYVAYLAALTAARAYWHVDPARYLEDSTAAAAGADVLALALLPVAGVAIGLARRRGSPGALAAPAKDQRGFALVMALGISVVMMIIGTTVAMYTAAGLRSTKDSAQRTAAYQAAETGLNDAMAWFYNNAAQWHTATPITYGPVSAGPNGATFSYTLTPNFPIWTVKATGTAKNKTNGSKADVRTIQKSVQVTTSNGGVNISLWNMFFSDAPTGNCLHWNAIVEVPMYIRGDMCLDSSGDSDPIVGWPPASLPGAAQLQVGGTITITPSGHLGYGTNLLNIVQTGVGCRYNGGSLHNPCNSSDAILAHSYTTGTANLTKPVIDLATWYKDSLPGPQHNCTSGSFAGGFDSDSAQNNSLGTVNLTPASAYDCKFTDAAGNVDGEVKWTPGSPGTLLINGTVFWDGNLVVSSSFNYTGRATFYFGGTITLNSGVSVCGITACTSSWNTNTNMLVLVAGSTLQSPSWAVNLAATSVFQGAIEAGGDVNQNGTPTTGSTVWGGIIAHQIYNLSPNDKWTNFNLPAAGQPGGSSAVEALTPVAGSFSG